MNGNKFVITGMSGRFPNCKNIEEFKSALLKNIDLVTDNHPRWNADAEFTPSSLGIVPDLEYFDAQFFGISPKQVKNMEPKTRKLLEVVYEALLDSGTNPTQIKGSNTGVFFATMEEVGENHTEAGIVKTSSALMANNISFYLNLKGPSYVVNTGCSSSLYALSQAIDSLVLGHCDSAIVCTCQTHITPIHSTEFFELGILNPEGRSKSFDETRGGYVKADAVAAIYIQRKENAKKIYATILGAGTNVDGYKEDGIMNPSPDMQVKLMERVYAKFNLNPDHVTFLETHGTGTTVGDAAECKAIATFFGNRNEPLLIGSVKSCMGHSEASSGLISIIKSILIFQTGVIPANLHFKTPAKDIPEIGEGGKLKVVSSNTTFKKGLIAINSFGFGGANGHCVLEPAESSGIIPTFNVNPRLVVVSGRTEEAVKDLIENIEHYRQNENFLGLINEIFKDPIENYNFRGYKILGTQETEIMNCINSKRPIWFVYSGMGSQWVGMAEHFMNFKAFADTFYKCAKAVEPHGINLNEVMLGKNPDTYKDIVNSTTSVIAMLVCLTDLVKSLGIEPSGMIGHSLGEIGAAYADGHFTAEQAVLLGYARGFCLKNANLAPGGMAAIGMSKEECQKLLPNDLYVACENSSDNVTISGPIQSVDSFVNLLTNRGVFARKVDSAGVAFHSPYLKPAAPQMREMYKTIIPYQTVRSDKWLPTSVEESQWDSYLGKYNSAEFHCNNFLNQVHFKQVLKHIPKNAILIEVAPRGLLQAIFKRSLNKSVSYVSLANPTAEDNVKFFLSSVGKIFLHGGQPNLEQLYSKPQFPLTGVHPILSSMIKWDHRIKYTIPKYVSDHQFGSKLEIDIRSKENKYLYGHVIDGKLILPFAGYMTMAWKIYAKMLGHYYEDLPVVFENVKVLAPTILSENNSSIFNINIFKSSGHFSISSNKELLVTGRIYSSENINSEFSNIPLEDLEGSKDEIPMDIDDFYKEYHIRGHDYSDVFYGVVKCDHKTKQSKIKWTNNWVGFLDMIIQTVIMYRDRGLHLPESISKCIINPQLHKNMLATNDILNCTYSENMNSSRCGGIELRILKTNSISKSYKSSEIKMENKYVPEKTAFDDAKEDDLQFALRNSIQIVIDNNLNSAVKNILEITDEKDKTNLLNDDINVKISKITEQIKDYNNYFGFKNIADKIKISMEDEIINLKMQAKLNDVKIKSLIKKVVLPTYSKGLNHKTSSDYTTKYDNVNLIVALNLLNDKNNLDMISKNYDHKTFIFTRTTPTNKELLKTMNFSMVFEYDCGNGMGYSLIKPNATVPSDYTVIQLSENGADWMPKLSAEILRANPNKKIYIVNNGSSTSGIMGLFKSLQQEYENINISIFDIQDKINEEFSVNAPFFLNQIRKNLTVNIYKNGSWGFYQMLPYNDAHSNAEVKRAFLKSVKPRVEWFQDDNFKPTNDEVKVCYVALDNWDNKLYNKNVTLINKDVCLGYGYSGITSNGKKVMGVAFEGSLRTTVKRTPLIWELRPELPLEAACTIALPYTMAYYTLIHKCQLKPSNSLLILNGGNLISTASINLVLRMGCHILTTISRPEDKIFLKKLHPTLTEDNFINCTNNLPIESVYHEVLNRTNGRGINYIVSCSGEKIPKEFYNLLTIEGKYVNITFASANDKFDFTNMDNFILKRCQFYNISMIDDLFNEPAWILENIKNTVLEYCQFAPIMPFNYTVYEKDNMKDALNALEKASDNKHVVIKLDDSENFDDKFKVLAHKRTYFNPEKSYILIGGMGGFGLELTEWMISRGAKKFILNSRRGLSDGYQTQYLKAWTKKGATIVVHKNDTVNYDEAKFLIKEAQKLGPVGGIFNAAMVVCNKVFTDLSIDEFHSVVDPKLKSSINFDELSRQLCPDLEYFVLFSSIISIFGHAGQTNYAYGNSGLDRLCELRRKQNLPATAIQWGPIADVGYVERSKIRSKILEAIPQSIHSCMDCLDEFLQQDAPIVSSVVYPEIEDFNDEDDAKNDKVIVDIARMFGIKEITEADKNLTLLNLGMDSLMSFEIRNILIDKFHIDFNVNQIRNFTLNDIANLKSN